MRATKRAYAGKIDARSDKLLGYLQDGPQTLDQLAARRLLYPPGFHLPYVESAERNTIRMHLQELEALGRVATRPGQRTSHAAVRRSISATRNANSSDCWVFSRGSQAVS